MLLLEHVLRQRLRHLLLLIIVVLVVLLLLPVGWRGVVVVIRTASKEKEEVKGLPNQ